MTDSVKIASRSIAAREVGGGCSRSRCEQRTEHPPDRTLCVDQRSRRRATHRTGQAARVERQRADHPGRGRVLLGYQRERHWIRHLHASPELRAMSPYLLDQSGYHKRLKTAQPLLCRAILTLATCCPSWFDDIWITDATPVPCGMSRETVKRSELAGHAGYGYCGPLPLVLGAQALPGLRRGRDADHVVSGQPQDQGTRGRHRAAGTQPPPHPLRADPAGRQGASPASRSKS